MNRMRSELLGFGVASEGQLGIRSSGDAVNAPEHIVGAPCGHDGCTVVDVAAGERHTVFLADDGKLWSVGGNEQGQLGRGDSSQGSYTIYPIPAPTSSKFVQISAGRAHTAAITEDGRLFMWGCNVHGQCGVKGSQQYEKPKRVQEINEVIQVACGPDHTIVLTESGRIYTFGQQHDGACFQEPVEMKEFVGMPILSVHAGGRHWAALSASGTVIMWGKNEHGQLGTNDTMFRSKPVVIASLSEMRVVDIALGDSHSLFLTRDGRVFACGADDFGQIGLGKRTEVNSTPKAIVDLMGSQVIRIAAGRIHSLVTVAGRVFSFGLNSSGQLGQGHARNLLTPRPIESLDHVTRLFAGWDQSFVLRSAGVASLIAGSSVDKRPIRSLQWDGNGETMLNDKLELIGQLESVFSSLSSINASFLYKDDRRFSTSSSNSGMALDDIMEYFNVIGNVNVQDRKTFMDLCADMLDMSLFSGEIRPRNYLHPECLRIFLVIPWLDFFVHPTVDIAKNFHVKFCAVLSDVKEEQMDCLNQWWLDVPVRHFRRLVVGLVAGLQVLVDEGKAEIHACEVLLSTLSLLHSLNGASNRISHDTFYINDLATKVDIKQDYINWVHFGATQKAQQFFWMKYPFVMNGVAKGELLHVDSRIQQQMATMETNTVVSLFGMNLIVGDPYFSIEVRRDHILDDTLAALLNEHPEKMRRPMRVSFHGEEAEDRGGVRKEFFMILFERLLNPDFGMFTENEESRLSWFSGVPGDESSFSLVGILTALAIYNEILVPFPFPIGMFKLLLRADLTIEDLTELSPIEGKGLQALLDYEGDDVEDVFCLTFTISFSMLGENFTVPLKGNGDNIPVTSTNREEYVKLYVQSRMTEGPHGQISRQSKSFCEGFYSITHDRVLNLFQPRELMELVIGNENYDWDQFRKIMQYKGVYHADHPTIIAFWDAFFELTVDERKAFLQFLTGTYRLPVHGFTGFQAAIQPTADHLLPVAHTCFNLLDLPDLPDRKEQLRRLRISIEQPTGFSLV